MQKEMSIIFLLLITVAIAVVIWLMRVIKREQNTESISFDTYEGVVGAALIFGRPISAVVEAIIVRFRAPVKLSGIIR